MRRRAGRGTAQAVGWYDHEAGQLPEQTDTTDEREESVARVRVNADAMLTSSSSSGGGDGGKER